MLYLQGYEEIKSVKNIKINLYIYMYTKTVHVMYIAVLPAYVNRKGGGDLLCMRIFSLDWSNLSSTQSYLHVFTVRFKTFLNLNNIYLRILILLLSTLICTGTIYLPIRSAVSQIDIISMLP